jgi:hypothetical protein
MLPRANQQQLSGTLAAQNNEAIVETGDFLKSANDVGNVVIRCFGDRPAVNSATSADLRM